MSSGGTPRSANAQARFVRRTLSFSQSEIMLRPPVSCSSFIALLTIRLSFSREPLPVHAPWQALFQHFLHLVAQLVGLFAT